MSATFVSCYALKTSVSPAPVMGNLDLIRLRCMEVELELSRENDIPRLLEWEQEQEKRQQAEKERMELELRVLKAILSRVEWKLEETDGKLIFRWKPQGQVEWQWKELARGVL